MMDNFYRHVLTALAVATALDSASAGEYCWDGFYSGKYCDDGCCGTSGNKYCCSVSVNIGAIVGGLIGGVTLLSIITSVICFCLKKSCRLSQLVQPSPAGGTAMSMPYPQGYNVAGQQFQGGQPAHGFTGNPAHPPNYYENTVLPPNQDSNPAYPPPNPTISGEQAPPPAAAPK